MSIESIKARLEAADNAWYIRAPKCEATLATPDLCTLLRVAEAAKARLEVWTVETYRELQEALAELEGMQ